MRCGRLCLCACRPHCSRCVWLQSHPPGYICSDTASRHCWSGGRGAPPERSAWRQLPRGRSCRRHGIRAAGTKWAKVADRWVALFDRLPPRDGVAAQVAVALEPDAACAVLLETMARLFESRPIAGRVAAVRVHAPGDVPRSDARTVAVSETTPRDSHDAARSSLSAVRDWPARHVGTHRPPHVSRQHRSPRARQLVMIPTERGPNRKGANQDFRVSCAEPGLQHVANKGINYSKYRAKKRGWV
jgi:hypothetical protein